MFDLDKWQEVWATLTRHKLRTFLTALGVIWGVLMMMLTIGFARGFRDGMTRDLSMAATNSVYVWSERTTKPYLGLQPGRKIQLTDEDIAAVARVPGIEYLAPRAQMGGYRDSSNISRGAKTGNFALFGDAPEIRHVRPMEMLAGRFIDPLDLVEKRKVAVIGTNVYDILFEPGEDPIGQYILARGVHFQVVGLFEPRGEGENAERRRNTVMIPFTTFQTAFNYRNKVEFFVLTVQPERPAEEVESEVRQVLAKRHKIHPDDREGLGSFNWAKEFRRFQMVFLAIEAFAWIASIFTLLAGALGVSNILLVAVAERRVEIGIRKALGATSGVIVRMVVQESLALTAAAGYVGMLGGVVLLEATGAFISPGGPLAKPTVDLGTAILTAAILVSAGGLAGIIPARQAARIPPVEALRAGP